ncbi:Swi5-domain-containing protein [Irpex lacteus]|nr:Swi5-domain-containing protein [Irpex lacteus]
MEITHNPYVSTCKLEHPCRLNYASCLRDPAGSSHDQVLVDGDRALMSVGTLGHNTSRVAAPHHLEHNVNPICKIKQIAMHASMSARQQQARVQALQAEITQLRARLGENEDADQIVGRHIKLLHHYNEAKDAAQILIGRLAAHRGITIRELHSEYGLTDQD